MKKSSVKKKASSGIDPHLLSIKWTLREALDAVGKNKGSKEDMIRWLKSAADLIKAETQKVKENEDF
jgi:hypothetical protein